MNIHIRSKVGHSLIFYTISSIVKFSLFSCLTILLMFWLFSFSSEGVMTHYTTCLLGFIFDVRSLLILMCRTNAYLSDAIYSSRISGSVLVFTSLFSTSDLLVLLFSLADLICNWRVVIYCINCEIC